MAKRGRKPRKPAAGGIGPSGVEPCSDLNAAALAEFRRLADALSAAGTLDRVDLAVLTEAARVKELLDKAHDVADVSDPATIKVLNVLTTQRRGLLRELGVTLQPSRSMVRSDAKVTAGDAEDDPIRKHIRIHG